MADQTGALRESFLQQENNSAQYPLPDNEEERLVALQEYQLLDTPPEQSFERLTGLASRLFNVPIVLISLIERERQFFKSHIGLDICETSREVSFCTHAIMRDDVLVVPDATKDQRFSTNPLVLGPPFIRFYAGKPLVTPSGMKLGTVCLIDTKPRFSFNDDDRKHLSDIASLVMEHMETRRLDLVRSISQARFENIARTSADAIIFSNSESQITFWNHSAERIFGYKADEVLNHSTDILIPDSWLPLYEAEVERLQTGEQLQLADRVVELSGLRKDGTEFPAEFSLSTWWEGPSVNAGAIIRDITERKENEERLFRLASLDPLTDLPNRGAWRECLMNVLQASEPCTVMLLDLDLFKEINDTLGHAFGDEVLKEVATRLRTICKEARMIARLGGDEFIILYPGNDARRASALASEIIATIKTPYDFAGQHAEIGVSIGISFSPQHSLRADELMGAADLALYRAKAAGKGQFEIFVPALREVAVARRAFEQELRQAFERKEFELFYQPQFSAETRELTGAEALIRWHHPHRGLLSPASFIDVLSQKPSAPEIGEWILRTASSQAARWRKQRKDFRIGVNLFAVQFRHGNLVQVVRKVLDETGLPGEAVELEIVENILLHDEPDTLRLLNDLRTLGVGLAFDDYGTGFASLSILKRYPVSRLKIDRTFIRDVDTNPEDEAVVRAILYLGRSFGMNVIAEGVETEAQLSFLQKSGCQEVQGYLLGRPVPSAEFEERFLSGITKKG